MFKKIFKMSLLITVGTLIAALVTLPFAVSSSISVANELARQSSYVTQYEQSIEGIREVNIRFTGRKLVDVIGSDNRTGDTLRLVTDGFTPYDVTTTGEVQDGVLKLQVNFALKDDYRDWDGILDLSTPFYVCIELPDNVPLTFDESDSRVYYRYSNYSYQSYDRFLNGFWDYCNEPLVHHNDVSTPLYQYAIGNYTREEFDTAFQRFSTSILADVPNIVRDSEIRTSQNRQAARNGNYVIAQEMDEIEYKYEYEYEVEGQYAVTGGEYDNGFTALPANTSQLVEAYLNCVRDYLVISADTWCVLNADVGIGLREISDDLDTLRQNRIAAENAMIQARQALHEGIDGCVYADYVFSRLESY